MPQMSKGGKNMTVKKIAIISLSQGSYCTHQHKQHPDSRSDGILKPFARIKQRETLRLIFTN